MLAYPDELDLMEYPLFVTWNIQGSLRGCIGTFKAEKLGSNLQQYSLIAALQDRRFSPISKKEIPHLSVEVSLLSTFEHIVNPLDWEVGKHGIEIEFTDSGKQVFRGTYLPHVASSQGWNQQETLQSLLRKAGYQGTYETVKDNFRMIR